MNKEFNTPILFLVFNRLDTTELVFQAIKKNKPSKLYIAADGPRIDVVGEKEKCEAIKKYILDNIDWDCEVKTLFRDKNFGCKLAVSSAISWFFENEEQGIILEDDCLPNDSFFKFCEEMLYKYKNTEEIAIISGDNFNKSIIGDADYYFSRIPNIWGWATWKRTWEKYDLSMLMYEEFKNNNKIKNIWSKKIVRNYWIDIFDRVCNNKINTWDYQLAFTIFLNQCLCVCPNKNLVSNLGFNGSFTNTAVKNKKLSNLKVEEFNFPLKMTENVSYRESNDYYMNKIMLNNYILKKILIFFGIFNFTRKLYKFTKLKFKKN